MKVTGTGKVSLIFFKISEWNIEKLKLSGKYENVCLVIIYSSLTAWYISEFL